MRISQDAVARLAGVCRATIRTYEAHPDSVGAHEPEVRELCDETYADMQAFLERCHARRTARRLRALGSPTLDSVAPPRFG
jgi:hypothetical protein